MHNGVRYRMPVDDFAFARGATTSVASKQEAEKHWEPKFIAEIAAGKDPRIAPDRETKAARSTTVADLLALYRTRYVDVEPLKSRSTISLCCDTVFEQPYSPPFVYDTLVGAPRRIQSSTSPG
jgi:hypothetical protein